jgi:hypothetical protein
LSAPNVDLIVQARIFVDEGDALAATRSGG